MLKVFRNQQTRTPHPLKNNNQKPNHKADQTGKTFQPENSNPNNQRTNLQTWPQNTKKTNPKSTQNKPT